MVNELDGKSVESGIELSVFSNCQTIEKLG